MAASRAFKQVKRIAVDVDEGKVTCQRTS